MQLFSDSQSNYNQQPLSDQSRALHSYRNILNVDIVQLRTTILSDKFAPSRPSTPTSQIVDTDHILDSNSPKAHARLQPYDTSQMKAFKFEAVPATYLDQVLQFDRVNEIVESLTSNLMECVFLSENHWVLITQSEAYVQFHHLDDCSRNERPYRHVTEPIIRLHKKEEGTRTWNELLLNWQNVKMLRTAGSGGSYGGELYTDREILWSKLAFETTWISGHEEAKTRKTDRGQLAFDEGRLRRSRMMKYVKRCGGALVLFVREEHAPYVKDSSLRDITKSEAGYPWSFCSSRFAEYQFKTEKQQSI
ncbi:hypothetical protein BGW37DRAFT_515897 [Umbelopsis sp. PMI_123]|nr:hypothetical protein BGW37DRAFT_515897 [Umbelopsis sp. PMI_123]